MRIASLLTLMLLVPMAAGQDEPEPVLLPEPPLRNDPPLYLPSNESGYRQNLTELPGWFVDVEIALLFPDIRSRFRDDKSSLFGRGMDMGLDADVSTTFGVGYQFGNGTSSFLMSYRYFGAAGRPGVDDEVTIGGLFTDYRTRLDVNEFNWTFRQQIMLPLPRQKVFLEAGARLASVYFDVNSYYEYLPDFVVAGNLTGNYSYINDFQISNQFVGAGPTVGATGEFELASGLTLFGHGDFAALFGRSTTRASSYSVSPGSAPYYSEDSQRHSATAKVMKAAAGLNWLPARMPHLAFSAGYQFEYWWDLNRVDGDSLDFLSHGIFARVRVAW